MKTINSKFLKISERILLLTLTFLVLNCLAYQEKKEVIEKNQVGEIKEIQDFEVSAPDVSANTLEFTIFQKGEVKYQAKVKKTVSLKRDKNGRLCAVDSQDKCGNYYESLAMGTIATVGIWIPFALVFEWIPAIFKTGESVTEEEVSELKSINQCKLKNGEAVFEYQIGEGRTHKASVANCVATVPLSNEFNSAYDISYSLSVNGELRNKGSLKYSSEGGPFGVIESPRFLAIRKNADKLLAKISAEENRKAQIANKAEREKKVNHCNALIEKLDPYSPIDLSLGKESTCSLTCNKYARIQFPRETYRIIPECNRQCRECWDVLSGKSNASGQQVDYSKFDPKEVRSY
ncbi:hypothetical protein [Leptospira stimsonii]|uniref:Lipoprotein n=1 Tax=Leptospira stimsonii TaxID=2202203 RepID=A0ABY2N9D8_9LEPT|nr:hypothetical protein [Leptospira stimsonii]TGK19030.1 hypothetical protein EHO98_12085 [Leptospira stimsonii]TGM18959.1 hypothetical protein EHQ90_05380 [Leptospira stimsonii]